MNLCTMFDSNYKAKGLALLSSIKQHMPHARVYVLALDDAVWEWLTPRSDLYTAVVPLNYINDRGVADARANRTWQEFVWTLSSVWTYWAWAHFDLNEIAYIDADCFLFSDLAPLYAEAGQAPAAIIPHRWTPKHAARLRPNGVYNVSWVRFLDWRILETWRNQCLAWCYYRNEDGKFADQGYLNDWPEQYGAHVVKHLGAGLAPWNAEQYAYCTDDFEHRKLFIMECDAKGNILRLEPVLFYHFHGWQSTRQRSGYDLPQPVLQHLYEPYEAELGKWM